MADVKFRLYDTENNPVEAEEAVSYELLKDTEAACDGLRLGFIAEKALGEINRVEAYLEKRLIFSGFCDTQRESLGENGFHVFIYARSSACVLLDNEAKPFTYSNPTAFSLFRLNAEAYGFGFDMEDYGCEADYIVGKGASCYGAINNFVSGITGKNIAVSPEGKIYMPGGDKRFAIDENSVISEKRIINRGDALSSVDYKTETDNGYSHHILSRFFEERGCKKSKKLNLSALPEWQRKYTLLNHLRLAAEKYMRFELSLSGAFWPELYSRADYISPVFGSLDGYYVSSVCVSEGENGAATKLVLSKDIDLKEVVYVA